MTHLNDYVRALVISLGTAIVIGCGGGGGGDGGSSGSSTPQAAPSQTPAPTPEPEAPPVVTAEPRLTVNDLNIAAENTLESVYDVDVDVDISALSTQKAFISICDNTAAEGDLTQLDFDKCLIKSSLDEGKGRFDLRVANHCDELIAVIWIMEKDRAPLSYTLSHNNQKQTYWVISE